MAHSTNIPVSPELRDLFTSGSRGEGAGSRYILVTIDSEKLVPGAVAARAGTLEADLAGLTPVLEARGESPAFVVVNTAAG
jgi:hypothetical protein